MALVGLSDHSIRIRDEISVVLEITSALPNDSREADEREEARRLRDLCGRVKAGRALVSRTPGLAEILTPGWQKAAMFYSRFGVTERDFRKGVRAALVWAAS